MGEAWEQGSLACIIGENESLELNGGGLGTTSPVRHLTSLAVLAP